MDESSKDEYVSLDLNDLSLGEIEALEELTQIPFDEMWTTGKPKAKVLRALAFVVKRRSDPNYDFAQTANLKIKLDQDSPLGKPK